MSPSFAAPGNDVGEITALIHEYAFRLDAGDFDGVAELFANAELRSTGNDRVRRGAVEARTIYEPVIVYGDGTPATMHQLTNVTVEVGREGAGTARARSYFTVLQVTAQGLHPILAGEYRDRFALVDGHWQFTERVFDAKLFGDLSGHMGA